MCILSPQSGAICVPFSPLARYDRPLLRRVCGHIKEMLLALVLSLFATVIVYAEDMPQGWVPDVLVLPDDAEVMMDRAIGSSIRMFSFSTAQDVEALFGDWSVALEENGYTIRAQQAELDETAIEFSGRDILNAKIATDVAGEGKRRVITFDATLQ